MDSRKPEKEFNNSGWNDYVTKLMKKTNGKLPHSLNYYIRRQGMMEGDTMYCHNIKKKFEVVITKNSHPFLEFEVIGVHKTMLHILHRLMLYEVPFVAVQKICVYTNKTDVGNCTLQRRLCRLKFKLDPRKLEFVDLDSRKEGSPLELNEREAVEFTLYAKGPEKRVDKDGNILNKPHENVKVFSSMFKWNPLGTQIDRLSEEEIGIQDDVLLAILRPDDELDIRIVAIKEKGERIGLGAGLQSSYYKRVPILRLHENISGDDALVLQRCFSPGVIGINEQGSAYVANNRISSKEQYFKECNRFEDAVTVTLKRYHFIYKLQAQGNMPAEHILLEAHVYLRAKCEKYLAEIEKLLEKNYNHIQVSL